MATANSAATSGTFDELLAGRAPAVAALMRQLRTLLLNIHPDAVEVVRLGDSAASFGVGQKR